MSQDKNTEKKPKPIIDKSVMDAVVKEKQTTVTTGQTVKK
jgi:hypothetical protein